MVVSGSGSKNIYGKINDAQETKGCREVKREEGEVS